MQLPSTQHGEQKRITNSVWLCCNITYQYLLSYRQSLINSIFSKATYVFTYPIKLYLNVR
jgi:hypothetical protein